jgi:hypothetical protein
VKKFVQQGLMMAAGFFAVPAAVSHADSSVPSGECREDDPRLSSLRRFFHAANSPLERLSAVFISEADTHHLDWRLLPGLSFIETSGGKTSRGNNIFGWNNGNSSFASVREGIHVVASRLAYSRYYKGKNLVEKLQTYNRNPEYVASVQNVMRRISYAGAGD